jgi:hypothetical protein
MTTETTTITMSTPIETIAAELRRAGPDAKVWIASAAPGWKWSITLLAPAAHPASGSDIKVRPVRVAVAAYVKADDWHEQYRDHSVSPELCTSDAVMGQEVTIWWGRSTGMDGKLRFIDTARNGDTLSGAVAAGMEKLRAEHDAAVTRGNAREIAIAAEDARYAAALAR